MLDTEARYYTHKKLRIVIVTYRIERQWLASAFRRAGHR